MDGNHVTMIVTMIVWVGLFLFLMRLDKKIKKLEDKIR